MMSKYWLVRPVVAGFETTMCVYGTEEELRDYLQKYLSGITSYAEIPEDIAQMLMSLSFKMYMCPKVQSVQLEPKEEVIEQEIVAVE